MLPDSGERYDTCCIAKWQNEGLDMIVVVTTKVCDIPLSIPYHNYVVYRLGKAKRSEARVS